MLRALACSALSLCWLIGPVLGQPEDEKPIALLVDERVIDTEVAPVLLEDSLYLPAREFLGALGAEIEFEDEAKRLTARLPRIVAQYVLGKAQAKRNDQDVDVGLPFRLIDGRGFLPARLIERTLDCQALWDAEKRRAEIKSSWAKQPVTVSEILRWPVYLQGKAIVVRGEYRGWLPSETGPAIDAGRPKRKADWILRDPTGAIYVSRRSPKGQDPLDDVGKRVTVEGAGGMTKEGIPFVEADAVTVEGQG